MGETKPTNPKDAIGSSKVPLHLVPDTAIAHEAMAFLDGALKYGKYNWRIAGVRASVYLDAVRRHLADWENGEDYAPDSMAHHLGHARACLGILLDALECGTLNDDRPPRAPVRELLDRLAGQVPGMKERHAGDMPHQYTIADSPPQQEPNDGPRTV